MVTVKDIKMHTIRLIFCMFLRLFSSFKWYLYPSSLHSGIEERKEETFQGQCWIMKYYIIPFTFSICSLVTTYLLEAWYSCLLVFLSPKKEGVIHLYHHICRFIHQVLIVPRWHYFPNQLLLLLTCGCSFNFLFTCCSYALGLTIETTR